MLKWAAYSALVAFLSLPASADIFIGVAGPMSGQYAGFGTQMKVGVEMAIADINAAGGINAEKLVAVTSDDACDSKRAVEVAKELLAMDVRLVVGHFCSGASLAAALLYQAAGVVMISPAASQPLLTDKNMWNVFRTTGRDDGQASFAAARLAKAQPAGPVAIISDATAANGAMVDRFKATLGKSVVFNVKPGAANYAEVASGIATSKITAIFLAMGPGDAGRLTSEIRGKGYTGVIMGNDALLNDAYWAKSAEAGEGTLVVFPSDAQTLIFARKLVTALRANNTEAEGATLTAYAAVQVFSAAAKARSVNNGRAMADWLKSGQHIDTVLGNLAFDAKGDLQVQPFTWYRWSKANFKIETP